MRGAERAPGILIAAAGMAIGLEALTFDVAFLTDPIGPKALPLLVAAVLVMAGVHATARPRLALHSGGPPESESGSGVVPSPTQPLEAKRGNLLRTALATLAFLLYAVALPIIGFFLSTTFVVAVLSRLFGADWRKAVAAAAALSAVLWLLFYKGLGLTLPVGDLWIR